MVRINKVYTKTGDQGTTALVGGKRVKKSDLRIEAYGCVDELGSFIGLAHAQSKLEARFSQKEAFETALTNIQQKLFDVGSILATPKEFEYEDMVKIVAEDSEYLESQIDQFNEKLAPLKSFVLAGGNLLNAHLHVARTVCRRAERDILRLSEEDFIEPNLIIFINRLSDLLFVMSRLALVDEPDKEHLWQPNFKLPL